MIQSNDQVINYLKYKSMKLRASQKQKEIKMQLESDLNNIYKNDIVIKKRFARSRI